MLVLTRKSGESIIITVPPSAVEQRIKVCYVEDRGWGGARLGFAAHPDVSIYREEIQAEIDAAKEARS